MLPAAYRRRLVRIEMVPRRLPAGENQKQTESQPRSARQRGLLPHLCGSSMPVYNPDAKGCFYGLTLAHGLPNFVRAILESVAFILKEDLCYIGFSGEKDLRITGGGAYGQLWPQIKADVTGYRLATLNETECACLGAAMLAGVGAGAYRSIEEAVARAVSIKRVFSLFGNRLRRRVSGIYRVGHAAQPRQGMIT